MDAVDNGSPPPGPAPTCAPPPGIPVLHKIRADANRLYDSATGGTFTPRGANYVRLRQDATTGAVYHAVFELGFYDLGAIRAFLDQMRHDGYNTARVFVDPGGPNGASHGVGRGTNTSDPLYAPYMANFASFVSEAAKRGVYVLPSLDHFPQTSFYWDMVARTNGPEGTPNMAGRNLSYLDKGRVAAKAEYLRRFAADLICRIGDQQANAILAYESDNEVFFEANRAPYAELSGTVKPLNGLTYDMSDFTQRQQSADASLVEYSHRIKRALLSSDPDALLAMGFFTNRAVGQTGFDGFATHCSTACDPTVDYRHPGRPLSVSIHGAADFLDLHLYPNAVPYDPAYDLGTLEKDGFVKPFILGELGARKPVYGGDIIRAANGMRDAQIATCQQGARGWLYWTWDTYENLASQDLIFKLTEAGGAINGLLAPIKRPDPCH